MTSDTEKYRMLTEAGPGHMVYGARWTDRDGVEQSVHLLLPVEADGRAAIREAGWPGHTGKRLDYFKDDAKRFFWSLMGH